MLLEEDGVASREYLKSNASAESFFSRVEELAPRLGIGVKKKSVQSPPPSSTTKESTVKRKAPIGAQVDRKRQKPSPKLDIVVELEKLLIEFAPSSRATINTMLADPKTLHRVRSWSGATAQGKVLDAARQLPTLKARLLEDAPGSGATIEEMLTNMFYLLPLLTPYHHKLQDKLDKQLPKLKDALLLVRINSALRPRFAWPTQRTRPATAACHDTAD